MDAERWDQVQALFKAVLEAHPADREAVLARARDRDPALYEEVRQLLEADADTVSFLDGGAGASFALLDDRTLEGKQVGPYRIIRHLGTGGMGAVYLAQRADGLFEQQVALKLIRRGLDSDRIARRFRSERQILARLHHPNIALLLDGGVTEGGEPYFAMEYVDGDPIDQYCDRKRLSLEDRLRLFGVVCKAVIYAHANLIVHRDLKPANILVREDVSGEPQVKLLDFGIAKVLSGEGVDLTRTGGRAMTPAYASPEQVRGDRVGTATDVYSLGVVLFELLTGRLPYRIDDASSLEAAALIAGAEPEKPSRAVDPDGLEPALQAPLAEAAAARGVRPDRLRRRLTGDLDAICLTALRKDVVRRYESVEALATDVRRHLDGLPVSARPDTTGYRLGKFAVRHRVPLLVASAFFLVLLASGVGLALQQSETARQRDAARREASKAVAVAGFLERVFTLSDPSEAKGELLTARDLLAEGARRVDTELADQAEVQAQLLDVLGRVHMNLGEYDEARRLMERALTVRRSLYGELHSDVGSSLSDLGMVLRRQGKFEEAEQYSRQALEVARAVFGDAHRYVAIALNNLAVCLENQERFDEAEALQREALAMQRRLLGETHIDLAQSLNNLALLLEKQGIHDEAEAMHREALRQYRTLLGDTHAYVAGGLTNLATAVGSQGRRTEAIALNREAVALYRLLYGDSHPDLARALNNLGKQLEDAGQYGEAERVRREAMGPIVR